MATAYHETRLLPVREGYKKTDAAARKFVRWAWNKKIIKLPYHRPDSKTGHVYYGRGFIQLTWAENYKKMGRAIGMGDELYLNPDLVLMPEVAAKVLTVGMIKGKFRYKRSKEEKVGIVQKVKNVFKGKRSNSEYKYSGPQKLKLYFNDVENEWVKARNIINGDGKNYGAQVAGYGKKFLGCLREQE